MPYVASAAATTTSFTSGTTWSVPSGVTSITVKMWGGGGGGGGNGGSAQSGGAGGGGGYATSILAVTPGESLTIDVGGGGGGATAGCVASGGGGSAGSGTTGPGGSGGSLNIACSGPGGGGGGGSFVKRSSTILIAAGGGGGGGGTEAGGGAGAGGGGGANGSNGTNSTGGTAGSSATSAGVSRSTPGIDASAGGGGGGGYLGGGAGGNPTTDSVGAAGGGGGTNYGDTTTNGSGTTPGNSADSLRGSYGNGGAAQAAGTQGAIFITYNPAPTLGRPSNNLGLVGYWSFDEATSTVVTDFSGNGNTGTLTGGPAWVSGKRNGGLSFSSAGQYVSGTVPASDTTYTVSAWIRYQGAVPISAIKVAVAFGSGSVPTIWMGYAADGSVSVSNSSVDLKSSTVNSSREWQHVAASVTGGTLTGYVNGISIGSTAIGSRSSTDLIVGDYINPQSFAFNGIIDEVRVYNRALSQAEVAALAAAGSVRFSSNSKTLTRGSSLERNVLGLWTFDGADLNWTGSVGNAYDRSGSNNNGTLTNMTRDLAQAIGKLGQAVRFDGTDDYVGVATAFGQPSIMTISVWFKTTATGGVIFGQSELAPPSLPTTFVPTLAVTSGGNLRGEIWTGATAAITTGGTVNDGAWHHAVLVGDSTVQYLYLDGALVNSRSAAITQTWWTLSQIGTGYDGAGARSICSGWCYFNGSIDDVRFYNRALSLSEISQLYRLGQVKMR